MHPVGVTLVWALREGDNFTPEARDDQTKLFNTKPVISLNQNMRFAGSFDKSFSGDVCGNATVYSLPASS